MSRPARSNQCPEMQSQGQTTLPPRLIGVNIYLLIQYMYHVKNVEPVIGGRIRSHVGDNLVWVQHYLPVGRQAIYLQKISSKTSNIQNVSKQLLYY